MLRAGRSTLEALYGDVMASAIAFFISAHPDDWQLFMNPNASIDLLTPDVRVVFLHVTAGDAGLDTTYWNAREQGAIASVRFRWAPSAGVNESCGTKTFNGRPIRFWSCANSIAYFMRLPDGFPDGSGSASYAYQSLAKLRQNNAAVTAVDGSSSYHTWDDLGSTVRDIIDSESSGIPSRCINLHETDESVNPGDHSDHRHSGLLIEDLFLGGGDYRLVAHIGYSLINDQTRLAERDVFWKIGMFSAYEQAVYEGAHHSTIGESPDSYIGWCLRPARCRTK
jgi:hypothetical protein